jgi:hypothetical protein
MERKAARDLAKVLRKRRQPCAVTVHTWEVTVWTPGESKAYAQEQASLCVDIEGMPSIAVPLIDGTFPDWQRVLPRQSDACVIFKASELRAALQAMKQKSEPGRAFKVTATINGHADLVAHHKHAVWGQETYRPTRGKRRGELVTRPKITEWRTETVERRVPCVLTRGFDVPAHDALQDVEAGFNARYVLELIEGERGTVKIHGIAGEWGPWRIVLESFPEATIVIMPCRV